MIKMINDDNKKIIKELEKNIFSMERTIDKMHKETENLKIKIEEMIETYLKLIVQ